MRRFSQRNSLVTLADINITPLLDLAFVLLIIFIITTPVLEQGMSLKLPHGGTPDQAMNPRNQRILEISQAGQYILEKVPMPLDQVEHTLVREFQANRNIVVCIRADKGGTVDAFINAVERCRRNGITTFSFRTAAGGEP